MQGGTIVQRKANEFLSNEFLEKVLAANPNCWGAAMVGEKELQLNSGEEGASLEFIQETMKTFEDKDITFYFGHADAALSKSDIPPYILLVKKEGEEEIPLIVGFFDGNFPAYDKGGSSHPPEYHLAVDYLIPKLEGLMEMADDDLDKVTAQLQKEYFKKELLLTSVSRGTITLVCANGTCLSFTQKDDPNTGDIPGGWTSNKHGYKTEAEKPKEPVKKPSMFDRVKEVSRSTVREPGPKTTPDNVTAATAKLKEATAEVKTDTAVKGYKVKKWKPSPTVSRREKKDQYKTRIGHLPRGWENSVEIEVIYDENDKLVTFSQIKALGLKAAEVMSLIKDNPPAQRDTETDHIPQPEVKSGDKQVTSEVLPIMSPKTREHIKDMMKTAKVQKIIAENADIIENPAVVAAIEAKFADFSRQLGAKSLDEFIPWSYEMMYELGKSNPDGLAIMCWTFRNIVAAHRSKAKVETAEVKEVVAEPSKKKPSMFARAG